MNECAALRARTYIYLIGNNDGDKKKKDTNKCVIKIKLKFKDYQNCLKATQFEKKKKKKNQLENIRLRQKI